MIFRVPSCGTAESDGERRLTADKDSFSQVHLEKVPQDFRPSLLYDGPVIRCLSSDGTAGIWDGKCGHICQEH